MAHKYHFPSIFPLTSSVGECGSNIYSDVTEFQKVIINGGYEIATGRVLHPNGQCDLETIEAIRWYQRLLNLAPTGLLHPTDGWYRQLVEIASPHWRPKHTIGILSVGEGQITFDAEGVDYITAVEPFRQHSYPFFSRVLHWPGDKRSGVTLGRGYDMGSRGSGEIFATLHRAGLEEAQATICSKAAYLRGVAAGDFVKAYGPLVGEITHQQQVNLFRMSYREKSEYAQRLYHSFQSTPSWMMLDQKVKDVVVDIIFQGCLYPQALFRAAVGGKKELELFIMNNSELMRFESQRKRIRVLR